MDNMSSGVALQKQIASIMDELAKAAVAEISKVVDDGVVMLRLEICERENEIDSLKRNLQMVSEELRETRRALVRQCVSGARPRQPLKGAKETDQGEAEREPGIEDSDKPSDDASTSRVVVKIESVDDDQAVEDGDRGRRKEPDLHSGSADDNQLAKVWSSENNTEMHTDPHLYSKHDQTQRMTELEQNYDSLGGRAEMQVLSGEEELSADSLHAATDELLRVQSHSHTHNALVPPTPDCQGDFSTFTLNIASQGRLMVGAALPKRRFSCAFCSKSFDRLSHLDRHQRIHTGEKPFSCMLCGRCFTQKSSLKSHLKTHRGFTGDLDAASLLPSDNNLFSDEWNPATHCEEQITHNLDQNTEEPNSYSSFLSQEGAHFIIVDEESMHQAFGDQKSRNFPAEKNKNPADLPELYEKNGKEEKEGEDQVVSDCQLDETRHSGSESILDEEDAQAQPVNTASCGKDSMESESISITEQSSAQNQCRLESTSTVLHTWGVSEAQSVPVNQIHVKQEEEDLSCLGEEESKPSYDTNTAPSLNQNSTVESVRTTETAAVSSFSYDILPRRRRVLNGRERRFLCVLCGKSFDRMSHLDRHKRVHTGEKPYSCVTCGRSFTQKSSLKGHMRTHTGDHSFSCSLCGMSFPTRASRYRHHCN